MVFGALKRVPVRRWIWLLLFLSRYVSELIRVNFRYTKYYMIEETASRDRKALCLVTQPLRGRSSSDKESWRSFAPQNYGPRFPWRKHHMDMISTLFHLGFVISCILVGIVIGKVGPYSVLISSIALAAVMNVLRIAMAHLHWKALACLEFFIGFDLALVIPALFLWMARWAPFNERGIFVCSFMGGELAELSMSVKTRYLVPIIGWQAIYYLNSFQVLILCALHWFLGSSVPDSHRFITPEELNHIKESQNKEVSYAKCIPPYSRMLRSGAFWILALINIGFACTRLLHVAIIPDFLYEYVGDPYKKSPFMEFLPYLGFKLIAIVASLAADFIRKRRLMKNKRVVNVYMLFSHFIPGLIIPFISLAGCDLTAILSILTISFCFLGFAYISAHRTLTELSPNFVGAMYGIIQIPVAAVAAISHKVESKFWHQKRNTNLWTVLFSICSTGMLLPAAIFWKFGKTECQLWNKRIDEGKDETEQEAENKPKGSSTFSISINQPSTSASPKVQKKSLPRRESTKSAKSDHSSQSDFFQSLW